MVVGPWVHDLESLEAINQDEDVRMIVLRLAGLARGGGMGGFMAAVRRDEDLDAATKATVLELAGNEAFLLAAEDYLLACGRYH